MVLSIKIWLILSRIFLLILPISDFDGLFKCNDSLLRKPSLWSLTGMQADVSFIFLILSSIAKFSANNFDLKLKFLFLIFFCFKAFICFDYVLSYTFIIIIFLVRYIFFWIHQQVLTDSYALYAFYVCLILV